jgi:hypothetical protein
MRRFAQASVDFAATAAQLAITVNMSQTARR